MRTVMCASVLFVAVGSANAIELFNNGPLSTGPLTESGVASPAGTTWSELQRNAGDLTNANTNNGFAVYRNAAQTTNFRMADDFTIGAGNSWTVNSVSFFAYRTGNATTASPFGAAFLQVWNGRPGDVGSSVVYGDLTTNLLATSAFTNTFRIFNTVGAPGAVPPINGSTQGTTRGIFKNTLNTPGLVLGAGTYWLEWTYTMTTDSFTSFSPSVTVPGVRGVPGANARQFTGTWIDAVDNGINTPLAQVVPQDMPFIIEGVPSPSTLALLGLGGLIAARRRRA